MAKPKFDLGDTLAAALGKVSEINTDEQIVYIDINALDADERNFYSMEGLAELAANIELVGLQQPLRVRENPDAPGRYLILSGHRRRAALWTLYEETPEKWNRVPCIVDRAAGSAELAELKLIMANADTRKMSSYDTAQQAERVQMLLYQLKEQGFEFPGRMRDHVAQACKVSATRVAQLKVIREKLADGWRAHWEAGRIPESTAYEIAKESEKVQNTALLYCREPAKMTEGRMRGLIRDIKNAPNKTCEICEDGRCAHNWNMLHVEYVEEVGWGCPLRDCCKGCYNFEKCQFSCAALDDIKAQRKKEKRDARKAGLAAEKERDRALIDTAGVCWQRFAKLRADAGMSVEDSIRQSGRYYCEGYHDKRFAEYENGERKLTPGADLPFAGIHADDVQAICKTADMFGCSTDYLLGRSEERTPEPAPAAPGQQTDAGELQFKTGTPEHDCVCWCVFDYGGQPGCNAARWKGGAWHFYNIDATIDAECVGWIELPDYERVLRK